MQKALQDMEAESDPLTPEAERGKLPAVAGWKFDLDCPRMEDRHMF
jgi:hypothetical protein